MIALRRSLLRRLTRDKFCGITGVIQAWPIPSREPHRATLWRWLNANPPTTPERIMELAGAFDLDPFALFETTARGYAALCRELARNIGAKRASPLSKDLHWVLDFIAPKPEWPPDNNSTEYFHREWELSDFRHTGRGSQNYFQKLSITARQRKFGEPQVWHFAFRVPDATFPIWTPYGFVERRTDEIALYHIRGYTASIKTQFEVETFAVETWFGIAAAEFRVASLHPFTLALDQAVDATTPCVRFG